MAERPLFVPLSTEPFRWFQSGKKTWEMRRARGAFLPARLTLGRPVTLRRGYSTSDNLHGTIGTVIDGQTIQEVFNRLFYWFELIPVASSESEAIDMCSKILGPKPGPFVAFHVTLEPM